jgi:hypothetical protein
LLMALQQMWILKKTKVTSNIIEGEVVK